MKTASTTPTTLLGDLVTTTGAARIATKANETIRHWANTGRLPVAVRLDSGMRLFRRDDVIRATRQSD